MSALIQRVACLHCGTHRMKPGIACICGECQYRPVAPGPCDLQAIEADVVQHAVLLDHAFQSGAVLSHTHPNAVRLAEACRALSLARAGILVR